MDYQKLFIKLLLNHIKMGYLRNKKIFHVLKELPLDLFFTPEQLRWFVLGDRPVLFFYKNKKINRTVSAPHMISMTTTLLELNETDDVLFLGAKGGYIEAVISKVVHSITILEQQPDIALFTKRKLENAEINNFEIFNQNPLIGIEEGRQFSKILITGAIPIIPKKLLDNFSVDGILVAPFILKNINMQSILQILKLKDTFQVANFGSVIFSPLYVENLPELNEKQDLTYERILSYIKLSNLSNENENSPFFEEFNQLPQIEIGNLIFHANNSIKIQKSQEFLEHHISDSELNSIKIKNRKIRCIFEKVDLLLYNPESIPIVVDLQIHYKESNFYKRFSQIHLDSLKETKFSVNLITPIEKGSFTLQLVCFTQKNFRIGKLNQILQIYVDEREKKVTSVFEPN
ncbi:MAG: hypothetical protein DRO88_09550 [Promethearchaeia archaeon]|nr:MAG: hypothetical protein DRO88_09550 [Candidatus Lokiarchaeia archaeon]